MDELRTRFETLTTAHLADACIRAGVPVRCAPAGTRAVVPGTRLLGPAVPARHVGSVDVFLEKFGHAAPGGVLVVDNGGRLDESCVGDLVVLEARAAGLAGVVIWGLHRDTADIREIGLPVFSLGSIPTGPLSLGPRVEGGLAEVVVGTWRIGPSDLVLGDDTEYHFAGGLRASLARVARAVGVGFESCSLDLGVPASGYVALDRTLPDLPGHDLALIWDEVHGWSAVVEPATGGAAKVLAY